MIDLKAIREWAWLCERQGDVIELNPATILALLDRLEAADAKGKELEQELKFQSLK